MAKKTFLSSRGPKALGPYSSAVISGNTVYLSGMGAIDPETNKLVNGSIEEETHKAIKNISIVLEELGLTLKDVLKVTVYMTDMDNFKAVNEIYKTYFGPEYPARTAVQVQRLPAGMNIEIDIIASIAK